MKNKETKKQNIFFCKDCLTGKKVDMNADGSSQAAPVCSVCNEKMYVVGWEESL